LNHPDVIHNKPCPQVKMQATAKRRLAQRRRGVFRAPATEVEPKQEGWLAPLEKKCPETQI